MTDKPQSPWRLNPARITILLLGALVLLYTVSTVFGGLANYQQLKEAAADAAAQDGNP